MNKFEEMLNKYGLSHEIFGIKMLPSIEEETSVITHDLRDISDDDSEIISFSAEPLEIEHDSSEPPWGLDEDVNCFGSMPDLNDEVAKDSF